MDRSLAIVVTCLAACGFTPGKLSDDARRMIDAGIDMMPDASQCLGASAECIGDTLRVCAGAGATAVDTVCGWGCDTTATPRCLTLLPAADGATTADTLPIAGLADVMLVGGMTIDTQFGEIGTSATPDMIRGTGTGVVDGIFFEERGNTAVFRVNTLRFVQGAGTPLNFVGSDAPIIIADGEIVIEGIVDLHGGTCATTTAGSGGFNGGARNVSGENFPANGAGEGVSTNEVGGGGGGHGTAGGNGGDGNNLVGPVGGAVFGTPTIDELGGGGGGGGGGAGAGGPGGGGGGAIQLISNTRIRILSGGINAGGCGGRSGSGGNDGGGGGGAGGAILLEAPIIEIDGALAVNGGGGGGGAAGNTNFADAGRFDRTPAAGVATGGAAGGNGAAGATDATAGGTMGGKGGGGGGGFGRIRIHTRADNGLTVGSSTVLSPSFTDPSTTCTRGPATVQ